MKPFLPKLLIFLCSAILLSACAGKPVQTVDSTYHTESHLHAQKGQLAAKNDRAAKGRSKEDYERPHHHHHSHSSAAGVIGYVIFRIVVESMIHALIYR